MAVIPPAGGSRSWHPGKWPPVFPFFFFFLQADENHKTLRVGSWLSLCSIAPRISETVKSSLTFHAVIVP